jgi:hypothetical protein
MNIVHAPPPNFAAIVKVFPQAAFWPVLICYGDTIYNPQRVRVTDEVMAHEGAHSQRQNGNPEPWWERYLADRKFRLDEEIIAHRVEYRYFCAMGHARHQRRAGLKQIAQRLASPLYGGLISVAEAKRIIGAEA